MPNNDVVFDYHEHIGHDNATTHDHDQHPRHHHDHNGSVHYYPYPGVVDIHNANDPSRTADLIGDAGFDITHRTR